MAKKKNVDYGHSRHVCSVCGATRYEEKMKPFFHPNGKQRKTRWGHGLWLCKDDPECSEYNYDRYN